jgi:predicted TIM-barrel enzyme
MWLTAGMRCARLRATRVEARQDMTQARETLFRYRQPGSKTLLVGGAIGVGMTAEAAERGGADFLLALSAGRYRVMGAASLAALLPLGEANRFTDTFARREILDRVAVPVFFGASCFDPATDLSALVAQVKAAGYHGIANFPTAIHFDGRFRRALEEVGIGFARETLGGRSLRDQAMCRLRERPERICAPSAVTTATSSRRMPKRPGR